MTKEQTIIRSSAELNQKLQQDSDVQSLGYDIKSPNCGRDKNGVFLCTCGKCKAGLSETDQKEDYILTKCTREALGRILFRKVYKYLEDKEHRREFEEWYEKTYGKKYVWKKVYTDNDSCSPACH